MLIVVRRDLASTWLAWLVALLLLAGCATPQQSADPLPSWNEGPNKAAIVKLVSDATRPGSPDFVPAAERIATFDNDGTLWSEHPMYVEALFVGDRVREMARSDPTWRNEWPYKAVVERDEAAIAKFTGPEYFQVAALTHAGFTAAEFRKAASDWLAVARHPRFGRPYTDLVYQPMTPTIATRTWDASTRGSTPRRAWAGISST